MTVVLSAENIITFSDFIAEEGSEKTHMQGFGVCPIAWIKKSRKDGFQSCARLYRNSTQAENNKYDRISKQGVEKTHQTY